MACRIRCAPTLVVVCTGFRRQCAGSVALQHVRSKSPDQGLKLCLCIARWILNHWATEVSYFLDSDL